jgi:hypothetical protein
MKPNSSLVANSFTATASIWDGQTRVNRRLSNSVHWHAYSLTARYQQPAFASQINIVGKQLSWRHKVKEAAAAVAAEADVCFTEWFVIWIWDVL